MPAPSSNVKTQIKTYLDELVTATTLGFASSADLRKDPLAEDIPAYPAAYLMPPAIESQVVDNRTLLRSYTFTIMVIVKGEDISSSSYIEDLTEAIMDKFDNKPTNGGTADGGMEPSISTPEPLQHNNRNFVLFYVTLKANKTITLTY